MSVEQLLMSTWKDRPGLLTGTSGKLLLAQNKYLLLPGSHVSSFSPSSGSPLIDPSKGAHYKSSPRKAKLNKTGFRCIIE